MNAPRTHVYVLTENRIPIAVYKHETTAEYDAWMCNASSEDEYAVTQVPLWLDANPMEENVLCQE